MTDERDLLIQRYLSGSASADEIHRIDQLARSDRDFGKTLVEASGMDAALKEILAVETEMIRLQKPRRTINLAPALSWVAAAAILAIVIWVGTKFSAGPKFVVEPTPPPIVEPKRAVEPPRLVEKQPDPIPPTPPPEEFKPPEMPPEEPTPEPKPEPPAPPPAPKKVESAVAVAEIEKFKGTVSVNGAPASTGLAVLSSQSVVVGWKSSAIVKYGNGTTIKISPNSTLIVDENLELREGAIHVDAKKPLTVRTPTSLIAVLGTRFDVTVRPEGTHVAVEEGRVRFDSIELPAGSFASSADHKPMRELAKLLEDHERSMAWSFCDWGAPADWILSTDHPYRGNGSFRVSFEPLKSDPKPYCQFRLPLKLNRAHRFLRFYMRAAASEKDSQWWVQIHEKDNDVWNVGGGKLSELEEGWNKMTLPVLANPKLAWKGGNGEYDVDEVQNIYFSLAGAKGIAYTDDWALIEVVPGEK